MAADRRSLSCSSSAIMFSVFMSSSLISEEYHESFCSMSRQTVDRLSVSSEQPFTINVGTIVPVVLLSVRAEGEIRSLAAMMSGLTF